MTNHNQLQNVSRSLITQQDRQQPNKAPQKTGLADKSGIDRALYVLMVAIGIVLGSLVVQIWTNSYFRSSLAIHNPALTPARYITATATATPTVMPTATPTLGAIERVAEQIPLLKQAWDTRDWKAAADHLSQIASLDSNYPGLQKARCDTYLHWAEDLEKGCQIQQAYALYRQASSHCQDRDAALGKKDMALRYLSGRWRYDHSRWSQAAAVLHTVYETDPGYASGCSEPSTTDSSPQALRALDTRSLLYASYLASSQELLKENKTQEALRASSAALELAPDSQEAGKLLGDIRKRLAPTPTPTPSSSWATVTGKRIEVSISKQRMYIWEGDRLLYDWVCSTGGPGSGTATGRYKVQNKIPEAWGSQWSLRMPYWLGIYNVGSLENGIHALPIRSNGTTLWAGYLGTPVSYGCIILSTENARTLYHWADTGTPVWIDY